MLKPVDYFLNRITMYRLLLYVLCALLAIAAIFGFFGQLPYSPIAIIFSAVFITLICWILNKFFSYMFDAPANVESVYITALILALIISPIQGLGDTAFYALASWASIWAISSKFIFAIRKKHIFNPAAFGVAVTALFLGISATWWVGTGVMMPFVVITGLLIVKKIRRFDLVLSFLITAVVMILGYSFFKGSNFVQTVKTITFDLPIFFFAFVMLTEPLTTPPTRHFRIIYGILTGILYAPFIYVAGIFSTPELALLVGNIFSYLASPKYKLVLTLKRKVQVANDTFDFVFEPNRKIKFKPGQYLEWTLAHPDSDSRGVRRYFTIASSPTENEVRMGVKFYPKPSTFKSFLHEMEPGEQLVASQLSGDFTMPKDETQKLVFIAGGIGVTPFRSMIKYMVDTNERRDVTLFYSNRELSDIAYTKLFDQAHEQLGLQTFYTLTDKDKVPAGWKGNTGFFDANSIKAEVPDYMDCIFYLSGPQSLVLAFEDTLSKLGVSRTQIKTDYFPGFA
ncbi:TPA: oxidoreductase [Candidatus Taylorbacteria bacterium]|nr:oxidoreductase [Candidatus Taylorbacteria bacterium]